MKNFITLFLIITIISGCGTRTKNITESEKQKTEKGFSKQNDSILSTEKNIQEKSSQTINRINEMNRSDETATNTKTTIEYDGSDGKPPLEIKGPNGTTKISGTGKVNVISETNSKQSIAERNAEIAQLQQSKINEENFKIEISNLTRQLESSQWETVKEKAKNVKVSRNIFWLWLALIISIVLNFLLAYMWVRK